MSVCLSVCLSIFAVVEARGCGRLALRRSVSCVGAFLVVWVGWLGGWVGGWVVGSAFNQCRMDDK